MTKDRTVKVKMCEFIVKIVNVPVAGGRGQALSVDREEAG